MLHYASVVLSFVVVSFDSVAGLDGGLLFVVFLVDICGLPLVWIGLLCWELWLVNST